MKVGPALRLITSSFCDSRTTQLLSGSHTPRCVPGTFPPFPCLVLTTCFTDEEAKAEAEQPWSPGLCAAAVGSVGIVPLLCSFGECCDGWKHVALLLVCLVSVR